MPSIREMILSESYADFILPYTSDFLTLYEDQGAQILNIYNGLVHYLLPANGYVSILNNFEYNWIPKIFTTLDTVSLEASGIIQAQNQPNLNLKGNDIIIGFIDTGIDYTHPAFRGSDGSSRIFGIWDQTVQEGTPPPGLYYGSEYTNEMINTALQSDSPLSVVPSQDSDGHGTFLASVAAGSENPEEDFIGAAPESMIAMVKLKEAKNYLKELFFITGSGPSFQESDIILGINYLYSLATRLNRDLVICLALGSFQGSHMGMSALTTTLSTLDTFRNVHVAAAAGNEAGKAHHFHGITTPQTCPIDVEILVPPDTAGFTVELWGRFPETYSVGFQSPSGEIVQRIPPRIQYTQTLNFVLEPTEIYIFSDSLHTLSQSQLIFMRFALPSAGVWKIRVYCSSNSSSEFHVWLPITNLSEPDITFLQPSPDSTLTIPAPSPAVITSGAYNAFNNSIYLNSSRGFAVSGQIKPDIVAPGVDLLGAAPGGRYTRKTGTSVAAAITAGAVAQITQWGNQKNPPQNYTSTEIKNLLIRGATRAPNRTYPDREWGYGALGVYQIFTSFTLL